MSCDTSFETSFNPLSDSCLIFQFSVILNIPTKKNREELNLVDERVTRLNHVYQPTCSNVWSSLSKIVRRSSILLEHYIHFKHVPDVSCDLHSRLNFRLKSSTLDTISFVFVSEDRDDLEIDTER
jgi:hypothetical protein